MPKTNKDIEQQIQLALDSLSKQIKPNISKTTREFALKRFLKRNPKYYVRRRRALNIERASALNKTVVERHLKKKLFNGSIINRESITVLEAISADSFTYPPLIILSEDKYIAITDTSYINDTLAY
ncbi:hypothetical protein N7447_006752 [Penicillium robsamsonii]|uniref:uncharacterized protein n=1 Tax=Penicillium robsamsonii TaxID=1792511 RepID=UPI0025475A15|nr:uncharacterized protein N7447_006752 [Penicillium robsamsonii]KAJ5824412.1 hypothetical protein N7447_006752 [Penicillium robsamsonii]